MIPFILIGFRIIIKQNKSVTYNNDLGMLFKLMLLTYIYFDGKYVDRYMICNREKT